MVTKRDPLIRRKGSDVFHVPRLSWRGIRGRAFCGYKIRIQDVVLGDRHRNTDELIRLCGKCRRGMVREWLRLDRCLGRP